MPARAALVAFLSAASWHAAAGGRNPFLDQKFYINPKNAAEFDASIATATGKTRENLLKMKSVPSAYWIDVAAKIRGEGSSTVEGILKDASSKSPPELVVLMWYDLPNRDCDALASNGEICCSKKPNGRCDYLAPGDCADGIAEYSRTYVDPFVAVLKEYEGRVPVALVMEPDGLANLATNIAHPHCGNMATQTAYKHGVRYAVNQLATHAPSVSIYLDAAHGGWLGWENNLKDFMRMLKGLELPWSHIRGFATNVANYQALGIQCPWCPDQGYRNGYCLNGKHKSDPCCADPCDLLSQYNFGNNELNYAAGLVAAANGMLGMDAHVIIDTGRNGVTDQRQDCANWCNPRGAGTGVPSTSKTANTSLVDAYFWLKTPGESDGCSETLPSGDKCPRFDAKCNSVDSLGSRTSEPRAPEAGHWFDYQVKQLAANAVFEPPRANGSSVAACAALAPQQQPQPAQPSTPSQLTPSAGASSSGGSGGACAKAFQQCGGQGWSGPTCCESGCTCSGSGGYYSQCTPPAGGYQCSASGGASQGAGVMASPVTLAPITTAAPAWGGGAVAGPATLAPSTVSGAAWDGPIASPVTAATTTVARPTQPVLFSPSSPPLVPVPPTVPPAMPSAVPMTPLAPTSQCSVAYGQCGGSGWDGPTCCDSYCSCQYRDAGFSECVPTGGSGAGDKDIAIIMKDAKLRAHVAGEEDHSQEMFRAGMALGAGIPALVALLAFASARLFRVIRRAGQDGSVWSIYSWLPQHGLAESAPLNVEAGQA